MDSLSLDFPAELVKMIFVERANRFILHCYDERTSTVERVHLADPGRLKELLVEGAFIYVLPSMNPNRKTKWTAVYVELDELLVSINTTYPNKLVEIALKENFIKELQPFHWMRSEYTYGDSRWDFLLENDQGEKLLLEVKSVTLAIEGIGMFPDAVTKRGTKHVRGLMEIVQAKTYKGAILFIVQREDVNTVTGAFHIDPAFAESLVKAEQAGVLLLAYTCKLTKKGIQLNHFIPVQP